MKASTQISFPKWNFKVEVRPSVCFPNGKKAKPVKRFYAVLIGGNGEVVFTGETRNRKPPLIKTVNRLFPGIIIVDKTK
jgi:hypothetical protein